MKWFKHYENAHTNAMIQAMLDDKNGLESTMRYWLLLELLCKEFKKDSTEFTFHSRQLKQCMRISHDAKLRKFMQFLHNFSANFDEKLLKISEISENFYKIETPIMLELMDPNKKRDRRGHSKGTPKNKNKKENKNIICDFDFEAAYQEYPRKDGKTQGIKKCRSMIKTQQDYDSLVRAIRNYKTQVIAEGRDKTKIKYFSSFMSSWRDYIEIEESLDTGMNAFAVQEILRQTGGLDVD